MLVTVPSTLWVWPPCASATAGTASTAAASAAAIQFLITPLLVARVGRWRRLAAVQEILFRNLLPDRLGRARHDLLHAGPLVSGEPRQVPDDVHELPRC